MAYALKKIYIAIATLLLTVVGHVHGDEGRSTTNKDCIENDFCESARGGKGFISADLLYLRAFEGGFDDPSPIQLGDYVSSDGNVVSIIGKKNTHPYFNWDTGFRLGTGYEFASDWILEAFWMHFQSHASRHHRNDDKFRNEYRNHWNLNLGIIDIIVGRRFHIGSSFTWTPFAALRGAQIKQKFRSNFVIRSDSYVGSSTASSRLDLSDTSYLTNDLTIYNSHSKQRFFGIGPVIGVEVKWDLGHGFIVYAEGFVAGLYGYFNVHSDELDTVLNQADFSNIKRHLNTVQPIVDAELGIRWHTSLFGSILWLQLGYEHHGYFNQNHFLDYGDLHLDGVNFSAAIAF